MVDGRLRVGDALDRGAAERYEICHGMKGREEKCGTMYTLYVETVVSTGPEK